MSRTQKLKELVAASLILKTLNDNPYVPLAIQKHILFSYPIHRVFPLSQKILYFDKSLLYSQKMKEGSPLRLISFY